MARARLTATLFAIAATAAALAAPGSASGFDADSMYRPEAVVAIDLELPPASIEALEADPTGDYVEAAFRWAETDGTPGGIGAFSDPALTIGVRLKGSASFRPLGAKAAFKLKFNEFVKGQKFLDLKKMTLNNMVQDPSMTHEALTYGTFAAAGVPAPRSGFARLTVNGEEYGIYANVETLDDVALESLFGDFDDPQHLYEGEYPVDVLPGEAGEFEVDEGDDDDLADLEALIAALNGEGELSARLAPVADLEEMTRMWAVERYVAHWDGYSGRTEPNNYYLYSDPAGVFQMLPWGTDQTWDSPDRGFDGPGGALFAACRADPDCTALYRAALEDLAALVPGLELDERAAAIAALLEPWQALEDPDRRGFPTSQISAGVATTRAFIAARPARLAAWLAGEGDGAGGGRGTTPVEQAQPEEPGSSEPAAADATKLSRRLGVDRSRVGRGVLRTSVAVPGAGTLVQRGWIRTADGAVFACSARRKVGGSPVLTLPCHLSPQVRTHLAARWLRLRLRTRFAPAEGGAADTVTRKIRLARESGGR